MSHHSSSVPLRPARTARPRVCILAETFHPVIGGCESQARLLADRLVARDYPVTVLTRRTSRELARHERLGGIEIRRVAPSGGGGNRRWPMVPVAIGHLWWQRARFDVVLVLGFRALGLAAVTIRQLAGVPCVFKAESNGEFSGDFFRGGLRRLHLDPQATGVDRLLRVRNRTLRRADAFVALSSAIEREFLDGGVDPSRVRRIPNGVDADRFQPVSPPRRDAIRRALGLPGSDRLVTYTGRLVSYKGLPLLLSIWRDLVRETPGVRLLFVGEGSGDMHNCEAELRSFVETNGLTEHVTFTGPVERVDQYLQASDIFVFPTENEAFGISLIEAMATGLACVSSAVGGVPDIVTNGHDGVLVPPRDGAGLRHAIQRLLAEPARAGTLGRNARQTVLDRYSIDTVTTAYADLIESVTRGNPDNMQPGRFSGGLVRRHTGAA